MSVIDEMLAEAYKARAEAAEAEVAAIGNTLPGYYYMDPPDGGDVSIAEQVRRMAADARRYRFMRDDFGLQSLPYKDYGWGPEYPNGADLDAAIDAELAKEAPP